MLKEYHISITTNALQDLVAPEALQVMIAANVAQDDLRGQIGHHEYHFDHNQFARTYVYLEEQRQMILDRLVHYDCEDLANIEKAWRAFGRLLHSTQDFYAHSNYLDLWIEKQGKPASSPEDVDPLDQEIIQSIKLRSGKIYLWEVFGFIPALRPFTRRILPKDSHAWMNLDSPDRGVLFPYAISAAEKRTRYEYEMIVDRIRVKGGAQALAWFRGVRHNGE